MKVVRYSGSNGKHKLLCVRKDKLEECSRGNVLFISGFPMRVVTSKHSLNQEDEQVRHLPIVHLDKTTEMKINFKDVITSVTVINPGLYIEKKIIFYGGMEDVFFITKVKTESTTSWEPVGNEEFGLYDIGGEGIRDEVELYMARTSITATIHRTLQLKRNVTAGVPMDLKHFKIIVHDWLHSTTIEKECNDYEYNILEDRRGQKVRIVKMFHKAIITDVDAFEKCFGFVSIVKHNCNMRSINKLVSCATTNGLFVCKATVDGVSSFEVMEMSYDVLGKQCYLSFKHRNGNAVELNSVLLSKQEAWEKAYEDRWAPPTRQQSDTTVASFYPFAGRKENRKRTAEALSFSIDETRVQSVFSDCLGIDYLEHPILSYVVLNMHKQGGETVAQSVVRLLKEYKDSKSIDLAIEALGFHIDQSSSKIQKIQRVADELQRLYDETS